MNTPDSPTPNSRSPLTGQPGDPKVNTDEQEVITNKDDTVVDTGAIEETLSESEPAADLNADKHITNNDSAGTDPLEPDEQF